MADTPTPNAMLADELERRLHGLTHGELYVSAVLLRECIAALRAPTIAADDARQVLIEKRARELRDEIGAYRVTLTEGWTDEYNRMCEWECRFDDLIPYGETSPATPSPTIAEPSPSESTCEDDGDRCEYSRTDCAADGSFNCQTHPSPSQADDATPPTEEK